MESAQESRADGEAPSGRVRSLVFRRRHRLSRDRDYQAVYDFKCRKSAGPLTVFVIPNHLDDHRLGLSIGKRVGNAVTRVRLKRMLRESFRHERATLPRPDSGSYDVVVTSQPHERATLETYRQWFTDAVWRAHKEWLRRSASAEAQE